MPNHFLPLCSFGFIISDINIKWNHTDINSLQGIRFTSSRINIQLLQYETKSKRMPPWRRQSLPPTHGTTEPVREVRYSGIFHKAETFLWTISSHVDQCRGFEELSLSSKGNEQACHAPCSEMNVCVNLRHIQWTSQRHISILEIYQT